MEDEDLFEALRVGAHGYLLKDLQAESFFGLLDRALAGEPALTRSSRSRCSMRSAKASRPPSRIRMP